MPDRHDLDKVSPDRPVVVIKHDGHSVFANTRAIEAAGVTASTPAPEAGMIEREADGYPSGVFREMAAQLILNAMPMPELPVLIDGARKTFNRLASLGLTSLGVVLQTGDEGPAGSAGAFDVPGHAALSGALPAEPVFTADNVRCERAGWIEGQRFEQRRQPAGRCQALRRRHLRVEHGLYARAFLRQPC